MNSEVHRLKTIVEDVQVDLDRERKVKDQRKARGKERRAFEKLPAYTKHEFWCDGCLLDFVAPAYKIWSEIHLVGSWQSFCPRCDRMVYRHVNHKTDDPYYEKSLKIRMMRSEATIDTLQPGEYGFRMMYGDPFEGYYRRFQERQEDLYYKYSGMGINGLTLAQQSEEEKLKEAFEQ